MDWGYKQNKRGEIIIFREHEDTTINDVTPIPNGTFAMRSPTGRWLCLFLWSFECRDSAVLLEFVLKWSQPKSSIVEILIFPLQRTNFRGLFVPHFRTAPFFFLARNVRVAGSGDTLKTNWVPFAGPLRESAGTMQNSFRQLQMKPYINGISPYIGLKKGLIYGGYLQFRFLKWPLST